MVIGNRIRDARKSLSLSQEALARRAEVSLSLINQIERGVITDPHYSTLCGIAEGLDVPIGQLLEEERPLVEAPSGSTSPKETTEAGEAGASVLSLTRQRLEQANAETRWFAMPDKEWRESFKANSTVDAAQKLLDIALEMEDEFKKLMSSICIGPRNQVGEPTIPDDYIDIWQQAAQRRLQIYFALQDLEQDEKAPEDLREQARMLLQSMRGTRDEEFNRLLSLPREMSYLRG